MAASSFFRYTLVLLTFILGCLAPDPADTSDVGAVQNGFEKAIEDGSAPTQLMTSVNRLVNYGFLEPSHIKYWTRIIDSPEHQRRLNNHLYYEGVHMDPRVLPLGVNEDGSVRIGAIFTPNPDLAEFMMSSKRLGSRPKGWETMKGMTLYDLENHKEPKAVGVLRFKLSRTAPLIQRSGRMIELSELETRYGLQVKRVLRL